MCETRYDMKELTRPEMEKEIFGSVFALAQSWQIYGDRILEEHGLTTKQWFLLVTLEFVFPSPPSLSELALASGSTRQNVKQLITALEKRGFIDVFRDPEDGRSLRVRTNDRNRRFWDERAQEDEINIRALFAGIADENLRSFIQTMTQLAATVTTLNLKGKKGKK